MTNPSAQTMTGEEAWHELIEKDDRNSPEEYPDHALITEAELTDFMSRAASAPAAVRAALELARPYVRFGVYGSIEKRNDLVRHIDTILATPEEASTAAGEVVPFAWVVLSDRTGDTRMWTRNGDIAKAFAAKHLLECIELYAAPPAALTLTDGVRDDLITALQFIVDGYDNHDVNHVDYRVKVYQVALDALAAASPSPQEIAP